MFCLSLFTFSSPSSSGHCPWHGWAGTAHLDGAAACWWGYRWGHSHQFSAKRKHAEFQISFKFNFYSISRSLLLSSSVFLWQIYVECMICDKTLQISSPVPSLYTSDDKADAACCQLLKFSTQWLGLHCLQRTFSFLIKTNTTKGTSARWRHNYNILHPHYKRRQASPFYKLSTTIYYTIEYKY